MNLNYLGMKKILLIITMFAFLNVANSQTLLHYFKFNNSTSNVAGTASFTGGNIGSYGIGMDVTNIGKRVVSGDNLICNLSNLPQGNAPRSFSIWSRFPANAATQYIFSYGTGAANQAFGISHGNNINLYGWSNDLILSNASTTNTWYHYVCTYDGSEMKLYLNGTLLGTKIASLNTTGTNAYIGTAAGSSLNSVNALVDELQIYSGALTQAQVTYLFTVGGPIIITPTISAVSSVVNSPSSATINYSLNANGFATTSIIKYGTSATTLTSQITGFTVNGSTTTPGSASLTGSTPSTTYYYQIEATNSNGTSTSTVQSFSTPTNTPLLVTEYNFNNTHNNTQGSAPFGTTSGSFVADRNGNSNSALNIALTGAVATIPNLPYGGTARTVSIWIKMNAVDPGFNFIYNYGSSTGYSGGYFSNSNVFHFASGGSHSTASSIAINQWVHYVFSYNGTQSKIYKNGVLLNTAPMSISTINNLDSFRLGLSESGATNYFNGAVDDLKIYNYAISDADASSLFSNNTLSSENFISQNLKATIYPNPTSDNFSIEMENEVKSVEIYSIQGHKVMTSNSKYINVSNLSKGMYLVRIEDENNAVATQKLIIK